MALIFLIFALLSLYSTEPDPHSPITHENEPSLLIEGKVHAISGKWQSSETDLIIQGVEPIAVKRAYINDEWVLFPFLEAENSDGTHYRKGEYYIHEHTGSRICYTYAHQKAKFSRKKNSGRPVIEVYRKYTPVDLEKGYTNTSRGAISSRTNLHNQVLWVGPKEKRLILITADGTKKRYKQGPSGYILQSEELPNGNWRLYEYKDDRKLRSIRTTNRRQTITYARAHITYVGKRISKIIGSDGQSIEYCYHDTDLVKIISSAKPDELYQYRDFQSPLNQLPKTLTTLSLPQGRTVKIDHYTNKTKSVQGHPVKIEIQEYEYELLNQKEREKITGYILDPLCGRIATLSQPVATDASLHVTHAFIYDPEHRNTSIYDIENKRTDYHWDEQFRLKHIAYYDNRGKVQKFESFTWSANGYLLSKSLLDASNKPLWRKEYSYNNLGDIVEERFMGDTCSSRKMTYTPGPLSLLHTVIEDTGKKTEFAYLPNTDLPVSQMTYDGDTLLEKRTWEYDANRLLIKETLDDGVRHLIRCIQVNPSGPYIGMPWVVEEKYRDDSGEHLLQKTVLHYTTGARIAKKDVYDADGQFCYAITMQYDAKGRLIEQCDKEGKKEHFAYDACGNCVMHKPFSGRKTAHFSYDFCNRKIGATLQGDDGVTFQETYRYDGKHRKIFEQKPLGFSAHYAYDVFGHLIQKNCLNTISTYEYDCFGRNIATLDPERHVTRTKYNARSQPIQIEHPDQGVEKWLYEPNGFLKCAIDEEGIETNYVHNALGQILQKTVQYEGEKLADERNEYVGPHLMCHTDREGAKTRYKYDKAGRLIEVDCEGEKVTYFYDALGRQYKEKKGELYTIKKYDALDRVIEETKESDAQVLQWVKYEYDAADNIIATTRSIGGQEAREEKVYDSMDRLVKKTDAMGNIWQYSYRHLPELEETSIDPMGLVVVKKYDGFKKIIAVETGKFERQEYVYDKKGNVIEKTSSIFEPERKVATRFTYDGKNRVIEKLNLGKMTRFEHDKKGRLIKKTKPDGVALQFEYNGLDQMVSMMSSEGSVRYAYEYDRMGRQIRSTDINAGTKTEKVYDLHGHLLKEKLANAALMQYEYDDLGRMVHTQLPDGSRIQYAYDALYLRKIARQGGYEHTFDVYDQSGHLIEETMMGALGKNRFQYNVCGAKDGLTSPFVQCNVMKRDAVQNILQMELQGKNRSYKYDDLYQLVEDQKWDAHFCGEGTNEKLQLVDNQYDANGNQLEVDNAVLIYDALDRLIAVKTNAQSIAYTYDADHRRLSKTVNGKTVNYLYHGQNEIGVLGEKMQLRELRILGRNSTEIGSAVAFEIEGQMAVPMHDLFGNVVSVVGLKTKAKLVEYEYSAFGKITRIDLGGSWCWGRSFESPWTFCSKRHDEEIDCLFFGRRHYSAKRGRWLTPDPIEGEVNPYCFVRNNPLMFVDAYGLYVEDDASSLQCGKANLPTNTDYREALDANVSKGTIHLGSGINTSLDDLNRHTMELFHMLDEKYHITSHHLHEGNLTRGLCQVAMEKLAQQKHQPFLSNFAVISCLVLDWSYIPKMIERERRSMAKIAQEIIEKENPNLKQCYIGFSNASYVYREALIGLPQEYRNTVLILVCGPTFLIERNLACEAKNVLGDKDLASIACTGYWNSRREQWNVDVKLIAQHETKSIIGGHYFTQPDYLNEIRDVIDNWSAIYEIN